MTRENFEDVSDAELIDAYQHTMNALQELDDARAALAECPVGKPYGIVKGAERLEQGRGDIEEELQQRGFSTNKVLINE